MSYLGFLDKDTLFYLLVRLHYEDLWNLCKTYGYLYKIICTECFQEAWKEYNIRVEASRSAEFEVDRLGLSHGKTVVYGGNGGTDEINYVQGVLHGLTIENSSDDVKTVKMYVNGVRHGLTTHLNYTGTIEEIPYIDGVKTGLYKRYHYENEEKHRMV